MQRTGSITASCGCRVSRIEDCIAVQYDDEEVSFNADGSPDLEPITVHAVYCPKCARKGIKNGWLRAQADDET